MAHRGFIGEGAKNMNRKDRKSFRPGGVQNLCFIDPVIRQESSRIAFPSVSAKSAEMGGHPRQMWDTQVCALPSFRALCGRTGEHLFLTR
jgi:hypothetical protein